MYNFVPKGITLGSTATTPYLSLVPIFVVLYPPFSAGSSVYEVAFITNTLLYSKLVSVFLLSDVSVVDAGLVSTFSAATFSCSCSLETTFPSTKTSFELTVTFSETALSSFLSALESDTLISPSVSFTSNPVASSLFTDDNKALKLTYFANSSVET